MSFVQSSTPISISYQPSNQVVEYLVSQNPKRIEKIIHVISTQVYWIARYAVSIAFCTLASLSAKINHTNLLNQAECAWSADWASNQGLYSASTARQIRSELEGLGLYRVESDGKGKSRRIARLLDINLVGLLELAHLLMLRLIDLGRWEGIAPHRYGFLARVFQVIFPGRSLYRENRESIAIAPETVDLAKEGAQDLSRVRSQAMSADFAAVDCKVIPTLAQSLVDLAKELWRKVSFLEERQINFPDLPF